MARPEFASEIWTPVAVVSALTALLAACVTDGPAWKPYDAGPARALAADGHAPGGSSDLDHALSAYYAVSPGLGDQFAKVLPLVAASNEDKARILLATYDYFDVASIPGDAFFERQPWDSNAGVRLTLRYDNSEPKTLRVTRLSGVQSATAVTEPAWFHPKVLKMGYLSAKLEGGKGPAILEVRYQGLERDLALDLNGKRVVVPFEQAVKGASYDVEGGTLAVRIHGIAGLPENTNRRHVQLRSLVRNGWGNPDKASRALLALLQDYLKGNDDPMYA